MAMILAIILLHLRTNGHQMFQAENRPLYKVGYSRLINEAPDDCYDAPLNIKTAKLQDVKRLLESVPESERYFYEELFNGTRDPITAEFDSEEEVEWYADFVLMLFWVLK